MTASIVFDFPLAWQIGLPVATIALTVATWSRIRRGLAWSRLLALGALRAVALFALVFLAARPVWLAKEPPASAVRSVVLLMDRSESMSLEEQDTTRYQKALGFVRERL